MTDTDTDPRPLLTRCLDQTALIVGKVGPDDLTKPTPCTKFDLTGLLSHVVGATRRIGSIARREPQTHELDQPADVPADAWPLVYGEARDEAVRAWSDDSILGADVVLPWATMPGAAVAGMYALELTVHAWDIAATIGVTADLDPWLAEATLPFAHQMVPADIRGGEMPFEAVVPVPDDAPPYDRLVAFLGRAPGGTAA
jgi:uncharacterized protein (TIGR03086 family)